MAVISRLALTDFRSYSSGLVEPGNGFVLLFGENGAGKTNLLEAVSMLAPGRGLRGAPLGEIARHGASREYGGWAVAARLGLTDIGTGTLAAAPERRQVRINGASASVNSLSEWLSILWLTPAMDRLFSASAGERRRFLDRLVLALEPHHAHHATRYDAAMRARNKLLSEDSWDEAWLTSLEAAMEEHGTALVEARKRTIEGLDTRIAAEPEDAFARAAISLEGWEECDLARLLKGNRRRDQAAGRTSEGPHRQDLLVAHRSKKMPAALSSTGEQKALLLGIVLAHRDLVAELKGQPPVLLLDEVAAHLDPKRRSSLFARLETRGQVWMTATERDLFEGLAGGFFQVAAGEVCPA